MENTETTSIDTSNHISSFSNNCTISHLDDLALFPYFQFTLPSFLTFSLPYSLPLLSIYAIFLSLTLNLHHPLHLLDKSTLSSFTHFQFTLSSSITISTHSHHSLHSHLPLSTSNKSTDNGT